MVIINKMNSKNICIILVTLILNLFFINSFTSFNRVCYISFQKPTQLSAIDYHNLSVSFSSSNIAAPNPMIYCKLRNLSNSQIEVTANSDGNLLSDRFIISHTGTSSKHFVAWDVSPICGVGSVTTTFKIRYFNCSNKADLFYSSLSQTNKVIYNPTTDTFIRTSINKQGTSSFYGSDIFLTGDSTNLNSFCLVEEI